MKEEDKVLKCRPTLFPFACTAHEEEGDEEGDRTACLVCHNLYSNSVSEEGWIKCKKKEKWAHEACAGIEKEDDEYFCDFCH